MLPRIPEAHWQLNADDPMAFTRVLDLPDRIVSRREYDDDHQRLTLFCRHAQEQACCPDCRKLSRFVQDYHRRTVRERDFSEKPCYREFFARRFSCQECHGAFREELDWLVRSSRLTRHYPLYLFVPCQKTTPGPSS